MLQEFVRDIDALLVNINEIVINFFKNEENGKDSERENLHLIRRRTLQIISWEFLSDDLIEEIKSTLKDYERDKMNLRILFKLVNLLQNSKSSNIFTS